MDCPKCQGMATNITPVKGEQAIKVFGCPTCGHTFNADGTPVVTNAKQLADVFRVATEGQKTLLETFGATQMDPATRAVVTTKLLEYGVQMWFDGLKQGILLTTISEVNNVNGKGGSI